MAFITALLRALWDLLQLLSRKQMLRSGSRKLHDIMAHLGRILRGASSRKGLIPRSADTPDLVDRYDRFSSNTVVETETVLCTSQAPQNISISFLPETIAGINFEAPSRPNPRLAVRSYSAGHVSSLRHNNDAPGPYAQSEATISPLSFSSRSASRESSRPSSTRKSQSLSPTRSTRRSHVSTGITTPIRSTVALPIEEATSQPSTPNGITTSSLIETTLETRPMYPILSTNRYDRNAVMFVQLFLYLGMTTLNSFYSRPLRTDETILLEPVTLHFELPNIPPGWTAFQHPEGALYFFNAIKVLLWFVYHVCCR